MRTGQLRILKWISAVVEIGAVFIFARFARHLSVSAALAIASALAVPTWTILHLREKGLILPPYKVPRLNFYFAVSVLLLTCLLTVANVMMHNYLQASIAGFGLITSVLLVIQSAQRLKEAHGKEVGSASS